MRENDLEIIYKLDLFVGREIDIFIFLNILLEFY